jgi:hypothetical protein
LPSTKILTWGVSSFPLGFDFAQKSPKRITPLFLFTQKILHQQSPHPPSFFHEEEDFRKVIDTEGRVLNL